MDNIKLKKKNHNKLNKNGYIIFKNRYIDNNKLTDIYNDIKIQSKRAKYIFNNKYNDKKRKQSSLNKKKKVISDYIDSIKKTINDNINTTELKYKKWIILKSLEGCEKQTPHLDYIPTEDFINLIDKDEDKLSYFFISAIENTKIYVYGKYQSTNYIEKKINIPKNSIILMRADLIHAGSDFDKNNIRIHCYLESPYLPMKFNKIHKIDI